MWEPRRLTTLLLSQACYRDRFTFLPLPLALALKTLLGRPHTNCVNSSVKTWDKKHKSGRQHHHSDRCAAVFIMSFVSTVLLSFRHVADIVSWPLHVLTHAGVRPTLMFSPTQCICVFRMILTINSDYFPKQHYPVGLCSGDVMCFLWGTNWIYIYCILPTQRIYVFRMILTINSDYLPKQH
jgi:hypothetical protein